MDLRFNQLGYRWTLREGFPPAGSTEVTKPLFVNALRTRCSKLAKFSDRELASWIVGRLNYLASGALELLGTEFKHDTNEFGYKIKLADSDDKSLAHGAVVIHADRTYFASVNVVIDDFQQLFVELLTEFPDDLAKVKIRVQYPETRRYRVYGWDGYSLLQ
jgi:hypothetical protein